MSIKQIYFAAGCYWGAEKYFQNVDGVLKTEVGFVNGNTENPLYLDVKKGETGYAESVFIEYDDKITTIEKLLYHYFNIIDPTSLNKQGEDEGSQYRTGIYYVDKKERDVINTFVESQQKLYNKPIVVEIEELKCYYPAHDEHQKYLDKNPEGYCHISKSKIDEATTKKF
ncbi:MAG: peptide-methionine (S)-S-oxide reductase MsrA [Rickettsiales bacterium]|jgi:methionine-S-sulfoxide reductase|nr:peptide-methionine (S)-S-oxide reductase MsrA [Rickettsiales bacterium]